MSDSGDLISLVERSMSTRDKLHLEIENTRLAFHNLLNSTPEDSYDLPSDNPAWTIGEVLYHMSIAPRFLGMDVRMIINHNWIFRLIPVIIPRKLFDWLNMRLTRFGARNLSPEFLAREYDQAHAATLRALTQVADSEFDEQVHYPGWDPLLSGEVTVERLFHYVKDHFELHAAQIQGKMENMGNL